jgi:ankyrin repeat protein
MSAAQADRGAILGCAAPSAPLTQAIAQIFEAVCDGDEADRVHKAVGDLDDESRAVVVKFGLPADTPSDPKFSTLLHMAARRNREAICRALVQLGAAADAPDWTGSTPLMAAADKDAADAGRALLDLGADVRAMDLTGANAMHRAAASGSIGMVRLILQAWPEAVHSTM